MSKSTPNHHQNSFFGDSPPPSSPKLTTSVYQTRVGIFSLTWSHSTFRRRSLHLTHHPTTSLSPPLFFHLKISPFLFWTKSGSKNLSQNANIFWDFSKAGFGAAPEPVSCYYIAVVVDGVMILLVGDLREAAFAKTKAKKLEEGQVMVLRREHVLGNKVYATKVNIGCKTRDVSIECRGGDDPRLYFSVDRKRVLQVKHLKWKFRGNERIELDGVHIQVSWDVYNWLFEDGDQDGYALFMFQFEKHGFDNKEYNKIHHSNVKNSLLFESQQSCGLVFEKKKMKKRTLRSSRSGSSSSLSSASSGCSSVMDWKSVEENELKGPSDFSLLVYAWKR